MHSKIKQGYKNYLADKLWVGLEGQGRETGFSTKTKLFSLTRGIPTLKGDNDNTLHSDNV